MSAARRTSHHTALVTRAPGSAFSCDVRRTIRGTLKRFVALATITALGVTMLTGLSAACEDVRASADTYYDQQHLFDIRVQSTLGLTDEDIAALAALDGVSVAEGGWVETAYTQVGSSAEKVDIRALSDEGLNEPLVLEGHLPTRDDQIAVTKRFLDDSGLSLGDTITFHGADDEKTTSDDADADASASSDSTSLDNLESLTSEDASSTSTEIFERKEYTIIASVLDPQDVNAGQGSMSFRSSGGSQYSFFVMPSCVIDPDVYTVAYLSIEGAETPLCYSDDYKTIVNDVKQRVEDVREEREIARGASLRNDATAQIDNAEAEVTSQLNDAEAELNDAQAQIDDGRAQLESGAAELSSQEATANRELGDAQTQIDDGYAELDAAEAELNANQATVTAGLNTIAQGLSTNVAGIPAALDAAHDQLIAGRASIESSASMLMSLAGNVWPTDAWNRLASATDTATAQAAAAEVSAVLDPFVDQETTVISELASYLRSDEVAAAIERYGDVYAKLPDAIHQRIEAILSGAPASVQSAIRELFNTPPSSIADRLDSLAATLSQLKQLAPGLAEIVAGEAQLTKAESGYTQLMDAQAQINAGWQQINAGRAELDAGATQLSTERANALAQIADGWNQINTNRQTLNESQAELDEGRATFEQERTDAEAQIADARDAVNDIPNATWYVQDRSSLSSYASVDSDASSIEAIGTVIPIVFFVVAVLISLTTMTRMVEEERGLIGLYKALGYRQSKILSKYALYATAACVVGGIVGNILGFIVLPAILFTIFSTMYALPQFLFTFNALQAVFAVALFALGIVGATILACIRELRECPASLMRPKAPRAGSRIFLEHIGIVWRHLNFLNKVSARNLFRYKRRFFMTVFGIAGCVALLVTGFGIRDTVLSLSPRQYGDRGVMRYDLMAVTTADDLAGVVSDLEADDVISNLQQVYIDSLTVSYDDHSETMQLIVVPEAHDLDGYITLEGNDGTPLTLTDTGSLITINAQQVMDFPTNDDEHPLALQDTTLKTGTTVPTGIARNYLSNMIFMTADAYKQAFGESCKPNGILAHLTGSDDAQIAFAEKLSQDSRLLSVVSTAELVQDFSSAFTLINTVVYVVIILAAALAFTVVFTLSNTNISERERELATIKVLGFRRREVHRYINKETLILTAIGIVVGMPLGYALARSLTWILKMPSLYFDVIVEPATYLIAAVLAFAFTLLVNLITNRTLDKIDMVGALKSAE